MAVRKALRETVFRFELVMRVNVTAHETVDREALVQGVLSGQMALLTSMAFGGETQPGTSDRLSACRDIASRRVDELLALGATRA